MLSFLSILICLFVSIVSIEGKSDGFNCNEPPGVINLKEFIISPNDPIKIGDRATLGLAVELSEDLVQPIKTEVVLQKKFPIIGYITGPCVEGVGSCTYPDWCDVCPTCNCPLTVGRHQFSLPFNVTSTDLRGTYRAYIYFTSKTDQTGCVQVNNIVIQ